MNNKLNYKDLVMIGTGHVIGAGIVSVIGSAIAVTGRSVWLAFLAACVLSYIRILPYIFFTSAVTAEGGRYGMICRCLGQKYGTLVSISSLLSWAARGTAVLALSGYLGEFFPYLNSKSLTLAFWSIFCLANLQGINMMNKIQNLATPMLVASLCAFAITGIVKNGFVCFDFSSTQMFLNSRYGFMTAVMLLSYSCDGIASLSNYSTVTENPLKNIPKSMTAVSALTTIIYVGVALSAASVLNPHNIENAALLTAAKSIFPPAIFILFVIFGPVFALLTTMNAGIPDSIFPVAARSKNGRLPSIFSRQNNKGAYYISILIVFIIGCLPLLAGLSVSQIASVTMILGSVSAFLVLFSALLFPYSCSKEWKVSKLYIPQIIYIPIIFLCAVSELFIIIQALKELSGYLLILNLIILFICFAYSFKISKKVNKS